MARSLPSVHAPCCFDDPLHIISSTFSNCSAWPIAATHHRDPITPGFIRIPDGWYRTVDATNNWWGTNSNPSGLVSGTVTTSPWLVLNITAAPSTITNGETSLIRANLTRNSAGTDTASGGVFVPDGIPVAFTRTGGTGSYAPQNGNLSRGSNSTSFMPSGAGTSTITATVDGETVSTGITVTGTSSRAGIFRNGLWDLDYNGNFAWDGSDKSFTIGQASDIPITGDWNNDGKDEVGIFRSGTWALDFNGNGAWDAGDKAFVIGQAGDVPVIGDWNGNGNDSIGIYRNGLWGLDYNDNYAWDGADKAFYLGTTGDKPVVGDWDNSGSDSAGDIPERPLGSRLQRELRLGRGRQGVQSRHHRG